MKPILFAALLLVLQTSSEPADNLRSATASIAAGANTLERRTAIAERLKSAGVDFRIEEFVSGARSGANIVVTLPGKPEFRTLLLGAHYDRVARGQGAVDNAASCAVLLELIGRLKSTLLNSSVTVVFFDLEEAGLLGSTSYLQAHASSSRPAMAMNFDIFAYGQTFFVTPSKPEGPLLSTFQQAASELGFPVRTLPMSQYPDSDHETMARAGIETLGVTLLEREEIDAIMKPGGAPPRILTLIHTDADTLAQVHEQDMAKAVPVLERTIRLLDARP